MVDGSANSALTLSGNGNLTVSGGTVEVNSTNTGTTLNGNGNLSAPAGINLVGRYSTSGNGRVSPTPILGDRPGGRPRRRPRGRAFGHRQPIVLPGNVEPRDLLVHQPVGQPQRHDEPRASPAPIGGSSALAKER